MNNRTLTYMTIFVLVGMGALLLINTLLLFQSPTTIAKYISRGDVRGMAVIHRHKEYTLNFTQQNTLIAYLNQLEQVPQNVNRSSQTVLDFEKIIVYKFKSPNVEITPVGYVNDDLLLSVPEWYREGLLKDTSHGELKTILSKTYDP